MSLTVRQAATKAFSHCKELYGEHVTPFLEAIESVEGEWTVVLSMRLPSMSFSDILGGKAGSPRIVFKKFIIDDDTGELRAVKAFGHREPA